MNSKLLKVTEEYRVDTENQAKELMEKFREESKEKGYTIKKNSYTLKTKKVKGEEYYAYLVSITYEFGTIWEDL